MAISIVPPDTGECLNVLQVQLGHIAGLGKILELSEGDLDEAQTQAMGAAISALCSDAVAFMEVMQQRATRAAA